MTTSVPGAREVDLPTGAESAPGSSSREAAGARARRGRSGPGVLVVSTGFRAGPWACRSLAAAGYRVVGAHQRGRLAGGRSLACPRPLRYPSPTTDPEGFAEALRDICRREGIAVVLPAAEDTARVLAERGPDLGGVAVVGPDRAIYDALCDKGRLADTAARASVDHPRTVIVGQRGPEGPWPALPSVVKPRISGEDLGGAPAVVAVATEAERDAAIQGLLSAGLEAIVQERIVGPRWVAQSVRDRGGRLDLVASRVERDYPRDAGVASLMRIVDHPPVPLRESVARLLGVVDYRGPSTISFIHQDGRWVVHDVNLRLGSSVGLVIRGGLDMPRRAVEVALGLEGGPPPTPRPYRYVRLDGEVLAIVDELRGRGRGESPLHLAGGLLRATTGRRGMVDPHPLEPFIWSRTAAIAGWSLARRARRAVGGRGRAAGAG